MVFWEKFAVCSKIVVGTMILEQILHIASLGCHIIYEHHDGDKNNKLDR